MMEVEVWGRRTACTCVRAPSRCTVLVTRALIFGERLLESYEVKDVVRCRGCESQLAVL